MVKTNIHVSIDLEIKTMLDLMKDINISAEVNNFFKIFIAQRTENLGEINLIKLQEERTQLQELIKEKSLHYKIIQDKINYINEQQKQKKIQEFITQQKRVKQLSKCFICGLELREFDKKEKLKNGFYIHSDITIYNCFQESMKQNLLL